MKNLGLVVLSLAFLVNGRAWAGTVDTTSTLSASPSSPSMLGQQVTLTAQVTAADGTTPTGSVHFTEGATDYGMVALSGSTAQITLALAKGTHLLSASYGPDAQYNQSGATLQQVVDLVSTTTALGSAPSSSVTGQTVAFTASVVGADGNIPVGTVKFLEGSIVLGTAAIDGTTGNASIATSALAVGTHTITATYPGNSTMYAASTSAPVTQVVIKGTTTTALSSDQAPSVVGQSVTFTATVALGSGTGTPTGTVDFKEGATTLGSASLSGTQATFTTSSLPAGPHSIVATYVGDASFSGSTSTAFAQQVNTVGTSVDVVITPASPSSYAAVLTVAATVSSTMGGSPTGTVTLTEGPTSLGSSMLSNGTASFAVSTLPPGAHSLTVTYGGDGTYAGAASTVSQVVSHAPTLTKLASSVAPSVFGQSVTFTATVSSTSGGTPTGAVTFSSDGVALGGAVTLASGVATFATKQLPVASHSISVVYSGDPIYAPSTAPALVQTVDKAVTSTSVVSSNTPSLVGATVTFTAVVTVASPGAGTPSGSVAFFADGAPLGMGTLAAGTATYSTTALANGTHSITALYSATASFAGSQSAPFSQAVSTNAATIALTATPNPSNYGTAVTLSAALSGGNGTPTGTVIFEDGAITLGSATVSGSGAASLTTTALVTGIHVLSAHYSGDAAYASGVASSTLNVGGATTTVTLVSSRNPSMMGESVTFTATVASQVAGATGSVQFRDGVTSLGIVDVVGETATLQLSNLMIGNHVITATYLGNANFGASTSTGVTQEVVDVVTTPADMSTTPPASDDAGTIVTPTPKKGGCDVSAAAPFEGLWVLLLVAAGLYVARRRMIAQRRP